MIGGAVSVHVVDVIERPATYNADQNIILNLSQQDKTITSLESSGILAKSSTLNSLQQANQTAIVEVANQEPTQLNNLSCDGITIGFVATGMILGRFVGYSITKGIPRIYRKIVGPELESGEESTRDLQLNPNKSNTRPEEYLVQLTTQGDSSVPND